MPRHHEKVVAAFWLTAAAAWSVEAASTSSTVTESIEIGGSVSNSTINNTINKQDPAVLAAMAKTFADQLAATTEAKAQADAKAAELGAKLGFTTAAVAEFFKTLGEKNVPEEKIPTRLIEIATDFTKTRESLTIEIVTHFTQTQHALAALDPDDPHAAELIDSAKQALNDGRLTEADALLNQAKEVEIANFRQARELVQKAHEIEERHALNAAKLFSDRGNIALTQLRYLDAANLFEQAASLVPIGYPDKRTDYLHRQADALARTTSEATN